MRRFIACVLLPCYLAACTSWKTQQVSPQQVVSEEQPDRVLVTLTSGNEVVVDQPKVSGDTLSGFDNGIPVEIPLANVSSVATRGTHAVNTGVATLGIVLGVGLVVGIVALSQMTAGLDGWGSN